MARCLDLEYSGLRPGDLQNTFSALDVFHYVYAIFYSPGFRQRYAELLKVDFPRVPMTSDKNLFRALAEKGRELISLHLMESPKLNMDNFITQFPVSRSNTVEKVRWAESKAGQALRPDIKPRAPRASTEGARGNPDGVSPSTGHGTLATGRVYINKEQHFDGIPKEVWEFHIGGYQVCEKWLKDRKGRNLSADDIPHYQKIVVALNETIRLMREIDQIIPRWPLP